MSMTYSSLFVNLEPYKVGTRISLSAGHPELEDAMNELRACLELTQFGGEPASVMRNKANGR